MLVGGVVAGGVVAGGTGSGVTAPGLPVAGEGVTVTGLPVAGIVGEGGSVSTGTCVGAAKSSRSGASAVTVTPSAVSA